MGNIITTYIQGDGTDLSLMLADEIKSSLQLRVGAGITRIITTYITWAPSGAQHLCACLTSAAIIGIAHSGMTGERGYIPIEVISISMPWGGRSRSTRILTVSQRIAESQVILLRS